MSEEAIKFIIARVINNSNDEADDKSEFSKGRKLAYYEILDTIKNELIAHDQNLDEFGLNINLEARFL